MKAKISELIDHITILQIAAISQALLNFPVSSSVVICDAFPTIINRQAQMCMMIIDLLGNQSFVTAKNLTILQMPQISTIQEKAYDACKINYPVALPFIFFKDSHIQGTTGTITLNRHTTMFSVLRRQLQVFSSSSIFLIIISIWQERTR